MRIRPTWAALALGLLLTTGGLSSCGNDDDSSTGAQAGESTTDAGDTGESGESGEEDGDEEEFESANAEAADQTVCVADATAIAAPYGEGFPVEWVFPPDTVVYNYEDRGETGVIVTAVSSTPFDDVLAFLNGDEQDAGFKVTGGETEEQDAEANWTSADHTGRWAIQKSGTCDGETVIQVLATPAG